MQKLKSKSQKSWRGVLLGLLLFSLFIPHGTGLEGSPARKPKVASKVAMAADEKTQLLGLLRNFPKSPGHSVRFKGRALTIESELQNKLEGYFSKYNPLYGAAAVIDASDGTVLALVEHRHKKLDGYLPLRSVFPAASIFKLVTASAAIEGSQANSNTVLRTVGNPYSLYPKKFRESTLKRGRQVTLQTALAKSYNVAFADLTNRFLTRDGLKQSAYSFGFDREIPFDLQVEMSRSYYPDEKYDLARVSTGLGENTLSPLHGALIAASLANDGRGYSPRLFDSRAAPETFIRIPAPTSRELADMMKGTMTQGTAKKSFHGWQRSKALKNAVMGGKTGTLSSDTLDGKCDWFVGFAKKGEQKIALSVILVNGTVWRVKSAYLARQVFENLLSPASSARWMAQK